MKKAFTIMKKEGETPLESLESFRKRHREYKDAPMTYAGRLDPMASGVLLLLAGEECKNKDKYLNLSKEYDFEVLFGFATDTYDILGKVVKNNTGEVNKQDIEKKLKYFIGKYKQTYPMYSSKTVAGKQLFEYAREGVQVEAPEREVEVKSLKLIKMRKACGDVLFKSFKKRIARVSGDFRQKEILRIWEKNLKGSQDKFYVVKFHIKCSSGTYVRSIANSLGEKVGTPALAYSIKRTKVGKWK